MRVGLVLPGFSADQSDWCIPALRDFARVLAHADDLQVFALRYPYRRATYRVDGAAVCALGGALARGPRTPALWREALQSIVRAHRAQPFDVLHAFWATESGLLAALAGRILRVPVLVSVAGGELARFPRIGYGDQRRAWERLKVRAALRLGTALSAGSRQQVAAVARYAGRAVALAPLGVDLSRFAPRPLSPPTGGRRVLHVAALVPVKDQSSLLRAFARVRRVRSDVSLDIAGDGLLRGALEQLARELGLADAVGWRGAVDHGQLAALYGQADVFVLSSLHEAQGMVVLEAAACGVPTVGTCVGVVPELAPTAAIATPVDGLADALLRLLEEPEHRAQLGQAARVRLAREFGLERCVERFRTLYRQLG